MPGELPLRLIQTPAGVTVRCLCGLEAARVFPRGSLRPALHVVGHPGTCDARLAPEMTPAAILAMIIHAQTCQRWRR